VDTHFGIQQDVCRSCEVRPHSVCGEVSQNTWLEDSVVLLVLAIVFAVIAAWPSVATKWVIVLVALIPAATAVLVYHFAGSFIAGHILLAAATLAILGGFQYPAVNQS